MEYRIRVQGLMTINDTNEIIFTIDRALKEVWINEIREDLDKSYIYKVLTILWEIGIIMHAKETEKWVN